MLSNIVWTPSARDHVAHRGITESLVEALLLGRRRYVRKKGTLITVIGKTDGRYLFAVLEDSNKVPGALEVVTARDGTSSERALFFRRGK